MMGNELRITIDYFELAVTIHDTDVQIAMTDTNTKTSMYMRVTHKEAEGLWMFLRDDLPT